MVLRSAISQRAIRHCRSPQAISDLAAPTAHAGAIVGDARESARNTSALPLSHGARRSLATTSAHGAPSQQPIVLGLGTNLGDRVQNIQNALEAVSRFARVKRTSFLYDNPPAYYMDQPPFLNAACLVETELGPLELLDELKRVERELGRRPTTRNGPRVIDLDIVFYGAEVVRHERLAVPHPRLAERDFVLQPVADMIPDFVHGALGKSVGEMLHELISAGKAQEIHGGSTEGMHRVTPRRRGAPGRERDALWRWGDRSVVMGILNATPDSFSDGGRHSTAQLAAEAGLRMLEEGAEIIDVGGESTRPGAAAVPAAQQIERVVPVIERLRGASEACISVDTRSGAVARAALAAGADMVNDVSGGEADPDLLAAAAAHAAPLCLMHMRGTPETMQGLAEYGDVAAEVGAALRAAAERAQEAGVPRWALLLDPGLGFAKTGAHSGALLRELPRLRAAAGPASPSSSGPPARPSLPPSPAASSRERDWATAGAACAAVAGGADVLRVHNVRGVRDALLVFDSAWRGPGGLAAPRPAPSR
eukprot:tig00001154_g7274.t1